jgi:hypothetical protein
LYNIEDCILFNVSVYDSCNEKVMIKIKLNKNKESIIKSNWMLPFKGQRRFMVGGTGELCNIKELNAKCIEINQTVSKKPCEEYKR